MATFSPSPVPRRSTRTRPPVGSPPRRIRVTGNSRPVSRLQTPALTAGDHDSAHSVMDVDEANSIYNEKTSPRTSGEAIFAKSEELTASSYANLPVELKQVLKNADFYGDAYTGDIDTLTGFALVASVQTCFVWQHAQAIKGTPTCYIFACPHDSDRIPSTPLHGLIPFNSSREPGLLLISLRGNIRFWDSIGIGLAGGDHYTTVYLQLSDEEEITNLIRSDPQTYILSTSHGTLFRLILTSSGGKYHLTYHSFARPSHSLSFSRLLPSIFSSSTSVPTVSTTHSRNVNAVALGPQTSTGGREVWALVDTHVQKWDMKSEGWEELIIDENLSSILISTLRDSFGRSVSGDDKHIDLELLDLAINGNGMLVILISYAGAEAESSMAVDMTGVRRIYALTHISYQDETFHVESLKTVPYQSTSNSGAPTHARIRLLLDGALISVQFGDAVALCAKDSDYRDRLELKSATDRTLGVGVGPSDGSLLILTASAMMKASIDLDKVLTFDPQNGRAKLIKSTMMQAILYSSPENPLHFSFPPEVDEESLMQGAEQLSQAVLESDPAVVRQNHDLGAQLTARKERLSWLIRFINDNTALVKMSQRSRQKLATDAEKLYACYQLWLRHDDLLASNPVHSILNDAVHAYMEEIGQGHHEDVMRTFFRGCVGDIGGLVRKVMDITTQAAHATNKDIAEFLPEANRIVLTVLQSAFDYREYNLGVYGVDLPMIKPWSSRPAIIDVILGLFDATTKVVDSVILEGEDMDKSVDPNMQLPGLATILFACIQERLSWLGSPVVADDPSAIRDRDDLQKKLALLRPEVLETLRRHGHAGAAFTLAERYEDFGSLVALCHREVVYPPEHNPNYLRIQAYIERFKDAFTTELFQWYIQHGEVRCIFTEEDDHTVYLDKFFRESHNNTISWMHDLGKARYEAAATALLVEAEQARTLETKHLMLSIGKLSHLAQLHEVDATVDDSVLDVFHDDLDFVSVHEALLQDFKSALEVVRSRQSLENQIDIILKTKAAKLVEKKALTHIFRKLVRELLQGRTLSMEDAVDVLTLKDNSTTLEDFGTALHLLARVQNVPNARKSSAFRTVWRRIYIHDDWDAMRKTANISDAELNEKLRSTALYCTFCAILPREHQPEGYETLPDVALITPSKEEISSRWPGMSPDQVEAITQDYNLECDRLGELDLNDVYYRIRELAAHDIVWQS
ncbi:hypothetical protein BDZ94DRAFT_1161306 [Collybia nuda]|uniref:Uncharacterized protein n=1 Tax=Collybia nuda TaxID=64659 RepID=A0A9P5Y9Q5_9AGAR|nr:hypothetical protein BDZ94DRAFT_1161306 [Collybia nuda]